MIMRTIDVVTSSRVSGKALRMAGRTCSRTEFSPQLPPTRFPRYVQYWMRSGLSKPNVIRHCCTAAGVRAFVQDAHGSGTATCVKKNVIVMTPKRTGTS